MCTKEDYNKFSKSQLWLVDWHSAPKHMMTFDEAIQFLRDKSLMDVEAEETVRAMYTANDTEGVSNYLCDYEVYDMDSYDSTHEDLEEFSQEFTTPSGESVIAFGYYGERY
jgi:hypothetical protein